MRLLPFLFAVLSFTSPQVTASTTPPQTIAPQPPQAPQNADLDKYISSLAQCESSGRWKALNPKDLDGTPSKGEFQFKDYSFNYFSEKYDVATTSIWNGDEQERIVRFMSQDLTKKQWHNQFPDCTDRVVGYPPQIQS